MALMIPENYNINAISKLPCECGDLVIKVDKKDNSKNIIKVEKRVNPYNQARGYLHSIMQELRLNFKLNYNSIVIFPYLKEEDLANKYEGYNKCLPKNKTIYKEDLDGIYNGTNSLEKLIKSKCSYLIYTLNDDNIKQINNSINI